MQILFCSVFYFPSTYSDLENTSQHFSVALFKKSLYENNQAEK